MASTLGFTKTRGDRSPRSPHFSPTGQVRMKSQTGPEQGSYLFRRSGARRSVAGRRTAWRLWLRLGLTLQHLIQLLLLIIAQRVTNLADGGFANGMDLFNLVGAGEILVADNRHGLLALIHKDGLYFGLLVAVKVQFLREDSNLLVDRWRLSALRRSLGRLGRLI